MRDGIKSRLASSACKLRNRAAHSENLLNVGPEKRLTDMLSTLSAIDEEFTAWSMNGSRYRAVVRRPIH